MHRPIDNNILNLWTGISPKPVVNKAQNCKMIETIKMEFERKIYLNLFPISNCSKLHLCRKFPGLILSWITHLLITCLYLFLLISLGSQLLTVFPKQCPIGIDVCTPDFIYFSVSKKLFDSKDSFSVITVVKNHWLEY